MSINEYDSELYITLDLIYYINQFLVNECKLRKDI